MNKNTLLISVFSFCLFCGCGDDNDGIPEWPWTDPTEEPTPPPEEPVEANPTIVAAGWSNVNAAFGSLPEYINVYKSPEQLQGKKAVAYIAVADMAKGGKFEVLGDIAYCDDKSIANYGAETVNTPDQFYTTSKAPIIINGGLFFYAAKSDDSAFYVSQNLVARNGEILAVNQTYWVEDWSSDPLVMWYPTIGTFCQTEDGTCKTTWTYSTGTKHYCYSVPADNALNKEPLEVPSATFPGVAEEFKAVNAIGGAGVLLSNGEIKNTWAQELLDVAADSNQPRTAIAYSTDKKLMFFVCEGRERTEGVAGLTTGEVANVLKSLGCTEALNLDGGGSRCMLVNGKETIKPSGGEQRAVLTGVRMY